MDGRWVHRLLTMLGPGFWERLVLDMEAVLIFKTLWRSQHLDECVTPGRNGQNQGDGSELPGENEYCRTNHGRSGASQESRLSIKQPFMSYARMISNIIHAYVQFFQFRYAFASRDLHSTHWLFTGLGQLFALEGNGIRSVLAACRTSSSALLNKMAAPFWRSPEGPSDFRVFCSAVTPL
jgi:hypothetical protein